MTDLKPVPCPLLPGVEPIVAVRLCRTPGWQVFSSHYAKGLGYVEGPRRATKAEAITAWNEWMEPIAAAPRERDELRLSLTSANLQCQHYHAENEALRADLRDYRNLAESHQESAECSHNLFLIEQERNAALTAERDELKAECERLRVARVMMFTTRDHSTFRHEDISKPLADLIEQCAYPAGCSCSGSINAEGRLDHAPDCKLVALVAAVNGGGERE